MNKKQKALKKLKKNNFVGVRGGSRRKAKKTTTLKLKLEKEKRLFQRKIDEFNKQIQDVEETEKLVVFAKIEQVLQDALLDFNRSYISKKSKNIKSLKYLFEHFDNILQTFYTKTMIQSMMMLNQKHLVYWRIWIL